MQQKQTLNDKEKTQEGNPLLRFLIINRYIEKIEDYQVICNQLKICVSHKAFVNLFGNISALTNRPDNK